MIQHDPPSPSPVRITTTLVLFFAAMAAYFHPVHNMIFWHGHERLFPVTRMLAMADQFRAGESVLTPWMPDACHGYGWPFFTYYAPLGYLVALFLTPFFEHSAAAVGASFLASVILSGLIMYPLGYRLSRGAHPSRRPWWALAATLAYCMAPYHTFDVFARAGLASVWSWPALAAVAFGIELSRSSPVRGFLLSSVSFCMLFLSHNITAVYGGMFLFAYAALSLPTLRALSAWLAGVLGFGMAAWFWIPALMMLDLVRAGSSEDMWGTVESVTRHTPSLTSLLVETYRPANCLGIGTVILTSAIASAVGLYRSRERAGEHKRLLALLIMFTVAFLMMTRLMPWGLVPGTLRYVQFPWRLLVFTSLFGAMIIPAAAACFDRGALPPFLPYTACAAAVMIGCIGARIVVMPFELPPTDTVTREWYAEIERTEALYAGCYAWDYKPKWVPDKYMDPEFHELNPAPPDRLSVTSGRMDVSSHDRSGTRRSWKYSAESECTVTVHMFDFPGWRAVLDSEIQLEVGRADDGLISLALPAGEHSVVVFHGPSPYSRVAKGVCFFAWITWIGIVIGAAVGSYRRRADNETPIQE